MNVVRIDNLLVDCAKPVAVVGGVQVSFDSVAKLVDDGPLAIEIGEERFECSLMDGEILVGDNLFTPNQLFNSISLSQRGTIFLVDCEMKEMDNLLTRIETKWKTSDGRVELFLEKTGFVTIEKCGEVISVTSPTNHKTTFRWFESAAIHVMFLAKKEMVVATALVSTTRGLLLQVANIGRFIRFDAFKMTNFEFHRNNVVFYKGNNPIAFLDKFCREKRSWDGVRLDHTCDVADLLNFDLNPEKVENVVAIQHKRLRVNCGSGCKVITIHDLLGKDVRACTQSEITHVIRNIDTLVKGAPELVEEIVVVRPARGMVSLSVDEHVDGVYLDVERGPMVWVNDDHVPFEQYITGATKRAMDYADDTTREVNIELKIVDHYTFLVNVASGDHGLEIVPLFTILDNVWGRLGNAKRYTGVVVEGFGEKRVIPHRKSVMFEAGTVTEKGLLAVPNETGIVVLKRVTKTLVDLRVGIRGKRSKEFEVVANAVVHVVVDPKGAKHHQFLVGVDNYVLVDLKQFLEMTK